MDTHTYAGHVFLAGRDRGTSLRLTGRLVLVKVFVDVRNSRWTEKEIREADRPLQKTARNLIQGARRFGKTLSIEYRSYRTSIDSVRGIRTSSDNVKEQVCRNIGFQNALDLHLHAKQAVGADEAVLLLLIREDSRSFSRMQKDTGTRPTHEYAVIFLNDLSDFAITHELLHTFGAVDLYYPLQVKSLAAQFFPDSPMFVYGGRSIDDLTAYLVGWREDLTPNVMAFLDATSHLTQEDINRAINAEFAQGDAARIRRDAAVKADETGTG